MRILTVFILAVFVLVSFESAANARSRSTPASSERMSGKESRFSLEDPRVALNKIKEANTVKEPVEKTLLKGVAGSPYSPEEQEAINTVEDLKKAYLENKHRPDGFGVEITREIILTLGTIKSKRSVRFLGNLLENSKQEMELTADIVESLRQVGDKSGVDDLKKHLEYLKAKKPDDPLAGYSWQTWIDKTQSVIAELEGK
jgi:HEAT repeat protein